MTDCPCLMLGEDRTPRHDDIVAEVTDTEYLNSFYVCRNHLSAYARVVSEFSIRAIAELTPRQSTFSLGGSDVI